MSSTYNSKYYLSSLIAIQLLVLACGSRYDEVPFPADEIGFYQPGKEKIRFSSPRQIEWPTNAKHVKPVYRKFNFNKLPLSIFDSTGFLSFSKSQLKPILT